MAKYLDPRLEKVQVDDKIVVVTGTHRFISNFKKAVVVKVTATQFTARMEVTNQDVRFSKIAGNILGADKWNDDWGVAHYDGDLMTWEQRDAMLAREETERERYQLARQLKEFNWNELNIDQLHGFTAQLVEIVDAKKEANRLRQISKRQGDINRHTCPDCYWTLNDDGFCPKCSTYPQAEKAE